jgi:DnaJ homologue, subfamily C, member 28, conserved domain
MEGVTEPSKPERPKRPLSWNLLAEERIQAAQADGAFENLPGFGKPIPGIDEPHDDLWWVKDKLKREQLSNLPPALAIRLDVEKTLKSIPTLQREADVRQAVQSLNERIRKAAFAASWGPSVDVLPLDVDDVIARWKASDRVSNAGGDAQSR